ncbi:hypothetical protein L6164_035751 [Bauhinia variegata]|uniref:Uncharacterized protein n=1 Tax=Bauhinia variegata TaxID=167791 RepID=A0ACB9KF19_BAUVA|nr:hypothetical protein L6164_035751 [Bauhinia variegata]
MVRGGITKSKMILLRESMRAGSGLSKFSGNSEPATESFGVSKTSGKIEDPSCWVPHPRTGIYFPEGHDWVMDDVPEGAASFTQACWFRNVDGVDKPNEKLE